MKFTIARNCSDWAANSQHKVAEFGEDKIKSKCPRWRNEARDKVYSVFIMMKKGRRLGGLL